MVGSTAAPLWAARGPNDPCASNDVDFLSGTLDCGSSATTAPTRDDPGSFYSCAPTGDPSSDGGLGAPPDTTELVLTFDYELYTSSPLSDGVPSSFEDGVARDLAGRLGLIDCGGGSGGRSLRGSPRRAEVVALDGAPPDEILENGECGAPVDALDPSASCALVRGYMTAYLPDSSSADAAKVTEARLLAWIKKGMQSDSYTGDGVVKASFVGAPGAAQEDDNGNGGGSSGNVPSDGSLNVNRARGADAYSEVGERSSAPPLDLPLLGIGASVSALLIALAVGLGVYSCRKRRSERFTDGTNDVRALPMDPMTLVARPAMAETRDPDDVQLLPCQDKLDLRSVCSDETSVQTENHPYGNGDHKKEEVKNAAERNDRGDLSETEGDDSGDSCDGANASKGGSSGGGSALSATSVVSAGLVDAIDREVSGRSWGPSRKRV